MATESVRSVTIIEAAVLNGPSTAQQRQRILALYAPYAPEGATTEQIAAVFNNDVRGFILGRLKRSEADAAARAAIDAAESQIEADYPEQP